MNHPSPVLEVDTPLRAAYRHPINVRKSIRTRQVKADRIQKEFDRSFLKEQGPHFANLSGVVTELFRISTSGPFALIDSFLELGERALRGGF